MKSELIKELHKVGVYRNPKTKEKLEIMKTTDILAVLNWVKEEMEKGVTFERKQCDFEFVKPNQKKEKVIGKGKKK